MTKTQTRKSPLFFLLLAAIYLAAWFLQGKLFLNGDNSYLLQAARWLMAGGSYSQDFFTPNPPMILFLNVPVIALSHWLGLSTVLSFRLYIFFLASLSLWLSYPLLPLLKDKFLTLVLAALFLILPLAFLGQREHFLFLFSFPYVSLVAGRLAETKLPYRTAGKALIGLLAGLGFAIKPHFLLVPVLLELYYLFRKKDFRALLRTETLTMLAVFIVYLGLVLAFFSDYFSRVLPFLLRNYSQAVSLPWDLLFLSPTALFCSLVLLLNLLQGQFLKAKQEQALNAILTVALLGYLAVYYSQRSSFMYHLLPALSLAIFNLAFFIKTACHRSACHQATWQLKHKMLGLTALALLAFPLLWLNQIYLDMRFYKETVLKPLIEWVNTEPGPHSLYALSYQAAYANPLVDYTNSRMHQSFDCLWPILPIALKRMTAADEALFIARVTEDLKTYKPDLVLVSQEEILMPKGKISLNYPAYFSQNATFAKEWRAYHLVKIMKRKEPFMRLDIYKRGSVES